MSDKYDKIAMTVCHADEVLGIPTMEQNIAQALREAEAPLLAKIGEQNDALMRYQNSQEALEAELKSRGDAIERVKDELQSEPMHKLLSAMKERAEKAEAKAEKMRGALEEYMHLYPCCSAFEKGHNSLASDAGKEKI